MLHAIYVIQPIPIIVTNPDSERYVLCFVLWEKCSHISCCPVPVRPFPLPQRTVLDCSPKWLR